MNEQEIRALLYAAINPAEASENDDKLAALGYDIYKFSYYGRPDEYDVREKAIGKLASLLHKALEGQL